MSDSLGPAPSFGIKTTPAHVDYSDIVRVWREADDIPEIESVRSSDCANTAAHSTKHCATIGRDPAHIIRSVQPPIGYDDPVRTRDVLIELIDAGFTHLVLNPPAPFPDGVAQWVADNIIRPTLDAARH